MRAITATTIGLALLFGIGGGALASFFLGSRARAAPQGRAELAAPSGGTAAFQRLSENVAALTAEIQLLRERLAIEPAPAATERGPGEASSADVERLLARIETLLERGLTPSAAPDLRRPQDGALPRALPILMKDDDHLRAVRAREHLLWTLQELLDAYGMPDSIRVDETGGQWLTYSSRDSTVSFIVHEGLVVNVW